MTVKYFINYLDEGVDGVPIRFANDMALEGGITNSKKDKNQDSK